MTYVEVSSMVDSGNRRSVFVLHALTKNQLINVLVCVGLFVSKDVNVLDGKSNFRVVHGSL